MSDANQVAKQLKKETGLSVTPGVIEKGRKLARFDFTSSYDGVFLLNPAIETTKNELELVELPRGSPERVLHLWKLGISKCVKTKRRFEAGEVVAVIGPFGCLDSEVETFDLAPETYHSVVSLNGYDVVWSPTLDVDDPLNIASFVLDCNTFGVEVEHGQKPNLDYHQVFPSVCIHDTVFTLPLTIYTAEKDIEAGEFLVCDVGKHNILKPEFVAPNIRALIEDARSSLDGPVEANVQAKSECLEAENNLLKAHFESINELLAGGQKEQEPTDNANAITQLKKRIQNDTKAIAAKDAKIASLYGQIASQRGQLEKRDSTIFSLKADLLKFKRFEKTVYGQNKIIAQLRSELKAQSAPKSLGSAAEMITKLERALAATKAAAHHKDVEIAGLRELLDERPEKITKLEAALAESKATIADRDNALTSIRKRYVKLEAALAESKATIADKTAEIKRLESDVDDIGRTVSTLQAAVEESQAKQQKRAKAHEAEVSRLNHRLRKYKDERNKTNTNTELLKATERKLETALASLETAMSSPLVPEAEYNKVVAERDILERILSRKSCTAPE